MGQGEFFDENRKVRNHVRLFLYIVRLFGNWLQFNFPSNFLAENPLRQQECDSWWFCCGYRSARKHNRNFKLLQLQLWTSPVLYIVRHCAIFVLPPVCGLFLATHNETCDNSHAAMKTGLCRPMSREENNPLFYFPLTPEKNLTKLSRKS
jgi:hypothetical protein